MLRRILGATTVICVGAGGAIGSGVFRTPGELAGMIGSPWVILLLWVLAGALTLMQSLVTAELATRLPKAGGEYQYLKEAYGDFAAFFFGWSFTIFIIGGGAAVIAAAFGDFTVSLLRLDARGWTPAQLGTASRWFGFAAISAVVLVNALGIRAGAVTLNLLTIIKALALIGIGIGAMVVTGRFAPAESTASTTALSPDSPGLSWDSVALIFQALLLAFWPYTGATDSAKLAEETRDVHRTMPRSLCATVLILTVLYLFYNYALLCAMPPDVMAGRADAHASIFDSITAVNVHALILVASMIICFGALSSVFLANPRVTFAMARDGLTFRILGRMTKSQAPVPTLIICWAIAAFFVLVRGFSDILRIYFMGSALLFGMTYGALIVFRRRDRAMRRPFPPEAYRLPAGIWIAGFLIVVEAAIAVSIFVGDVKTWAGSEPRYDSLGSVALLVVLACLYGLWRRYNPPRRRDPGGD